MNEQRTYPCLVKVNGSNLARCGISAPDRKTAVQKMLLWFWEEYKGKYGPASEVLTVGDPYNEVVFSGEFNCSHKANNYLDEPTLTRVIAEFEGTLMRETALGTKHHPRRSLRRKNRRRKYRRTVAPNIQESSTGRFYYRIIVVPQKSRRGEVLVKRKMKEEKLKAKTLPEAIEEIQEKGLKRISEENTARKNGKARSLKLASHLAGIRPLQGDDLTYFSRLLRSRKMAKPGKGEGVAV